MDLSYSQRAKEIFSHWVEDNIKIRTESCNLPYICISITWMECRETLKRSPQNDNSAFTYGQVNFLGAYFCIEFAH